MAGILSIIGMITGSIGIFFGFYYLSGNLSASIRIVTITTVGIVGILAFVRHVIFHKSDAKRLGWETDRPDWIYEVGFANLAFGTIGVLSVFINQGDTDTSSCVAGICNISTTGCRPSWVSVFYREQ